MNIKSQSIDMYKVHKYCLQLSYFPKRNKQEQYISVKYKLKCKVMKAKLFKAQNSRYLTNQKLKIKIKVIFSSLQVQILNKYTKLVIIINLMLTSKKLDLKQMKLAKHKDIKGVCNGILSSRIQKFKNQGESIIFFRQHFESLFYSQDATYPILDKIDLNIGKQLDNMENDIDTKILVSIKPDRIQLYILDQLKATILAESGQYFIPNSDLQDSTLLAKKMLSLSIWIRIDIVSNQIQINTGDIAKLQSANANIFKSRQRIVSPIYDVKLPKQWIKSVLKFNPKQKTTKKKQKWLDQIFNYQVDYWGTLKGMNKAFEDNILHECNQIEQLPLQRILDSKISKQPELLQKQTAVQDLNGQCRAIFSQIQNFDLKNITTSNNTSKEQFYQIKGWKNLGAAIDNSIRQSYHYKQVQKQGKIVKKPVGILNHMLKTKIAAYNQAYIFNLEASKKPSKKQIYEKRMFNCRFQLVGNEGIPIGSNAVLEVYPPYTCSPIHNHCDSNGVMKLLKGSINVQNFTNLDLLSTNDQPYKTDKYQQGEFSWFSKHSYGIHRVINTTPSTSILLQSYNGHKGTKEYFQFIEKNDEQNYYCQYYHQDDWQNYLRWQPEEVTEETQKDVDFINSVKSFYNLQKDGNLDDSFPRLILIMKQEFEGEQ